MAPRSGGVRRAVDRGIAVARPDPGLKYRAFPPVGLSGRRWPDGTILAPPAWCSVDLRDGNQALVEPMDPDRKLALFRGLVEIGFKEIEVGFPAASELDFRFVRLLIERDLVPADVTLQVLTQARKGIIEQTVEAVRGARRVIIHLYNSTSPVQRQVVFGRSRAGVLDLAAGGARLIRNLLPSLRPRTEVVFEYSPESFTATELDFSLEVCEAVMEAWSPADGERVILNLPATVELATPNVYADQIEWFCAN